MINPPRTKEEAKDIGYGKWGGNKEGYSYDEKCCAYKVWSEGDWTDHQCYRKSGHGADNLYCKQHAEIVEKIFKNEFYG